MLSNLVSCIDLIFTPRSYLMHSSIHPSLKTNCHHQTVFTKFTLSTVYFSLNRWLFQIRMLKSKSLDKLDALQAKLHSSRNFFQCYYYRKNSKQLFDPATNSNCYWTILKTFLERLKVFFTITDLSLTSKKKQFLQLILYKTVFIN